MLLGRVAECEQIDALLARVRVGESAALVVRGEPGIGKSALLDHAVAAAGDAIVLRARGVESEVQIAFGGLHELLRPVLGALDRLPSPQARALRGALGLAEAAGAERDLVGAATLGLFDVLAETAPVLVVIDDVQWLDGPSAGAVVFAARRLLADAVAVILAVRSGEPSAANTAGLPELLLAGLGLEPARELVAAHAARPVAADTAAWLHAVTGGNPLALVELASEAPRLRPAPVGVDVPVGERIQRALGRRLDALSDAARLSLLMAAIADSEEIEPVLAAGATLPGLEEAEVAGLLHVSAGRVTFRHPLVRSVAVHTAEPAARRAAHRAYAHALRPAAGEDGRALGTERGEDGRALGTERGEDGRALGTERGEDGRAVGTERDEERRALGTERDEGGRVPGTELGEDRRALGTERGEDRRAWHLAAGTVAPDEAIAAALAAAGARAGARGGHAAAAAALEQAARLTPAASPRTQRLRAAASEAWLGGDAERALALLAEASVLAEGAAARAAVAHLRGRVLARHGPLPLAISVLRDGADEIAAQDPARACEMLAECAYTALYGSAGEEMEAAARRAVELAPADDARARCLASAALGAALVLRGHGDATAWLEEAAALLEATPQLQDDVALAAWMAVPAIFLRGSADDYEPLRHGLAAARERGAVGALPFPLFKLGTAAMAGDDWDEAVAAYEEAMRLAGEAGLRVDQVAAEAGLARVLARRGRADAAEHAVATVAVASALGMPFFTAWGLQAQGDLAWGRGDVEGAIAAFEAKAARLAEHGMADPDLSPAPELAEGYLRVGRDQDARSAAAESVAAARAKGRPWALARAARAQALVATDDAAAFEHFQVALALHGETTDAFEHARTQLSLGERLRRAGRRADARVELRAASDRFEGLRAAPWAERAREELKATGETVRRRDPSSLDELTPQELRIALMLAEGTTTRQAAAALYLSPKTVEYHLRNVYLKLGINSREALAVQLRRGQSSSAISAAARAAPSPRTGS